MVNLNLWGWCGRTILYNFILIYGQNIIYLQRFGVHTIFFAWFDLAILFIFSFYNFFL